MSSLPPPTNGAQPPTQSKAGHLATLATTFFYKHFYFHQGHILHTKAFAPSTTATTVGDGGNPRGSTELDEVTGHNCNMSQEDYLVVAMLVLGLWPGKHMAQNKVTVCL
jgi:hypothetical protein